MLQLTLMVVVVVVIRNVHVCLLSVFVVHVVVHSC